jgi:hypothetical protein
MSTTQLSSAASSIVTRTMANAGNMMPMLPNQPLPQMATLHPAILQQQQMNPRLPQHPLPPTMASITVVQTPRSASPVKPAQHVALKKREYIAAKAAEQELELLKKEAEAKAAIAAASIVPAKKEYIKPRDVFGGGAHLIKDEKIFPIALNSLQPPPPSSPSLPSPEQLVILRDQEVTLLFQALLKQGNPEHIAMSLARDMAQDRYKAAIAATVVMCGVSNDNGLDFRPMPAHGASTEAMRRQSASPLVPLAHAHSRMPSTNPYVHDPYGDQRRVVMSMNPASPEPPPEFVLPCLESYPVVWQGFLGLKNDYATVQFHYVSGCKDLARASLPQDQHAQMATLRIGQRMRLEAAHLSGVRMKMQQAAEHCVLLALPCGKDPTDVEAQSRQLRSHFITYLQLKGAAGIVNVLGEHPGNPHEGGYVVHVFPSCDFANETMTSIAPDLLARVAEIEHMVIVIATVMDNKTLD